MEHWKNYTARASLCTGNCIDAAGGNDPADSHASAGGKAWIIQYRGHVLSVFPGQGARLYGFAAKIRICVFDAWRHSFFDEFWRRNFFDFCNDFALIVEKEKSFVYNS